MTIEVIAADLPDTTLIAGTTTRRGGVSNGPYRSLNLGAHVGDEPDHVAENRRRLVEIVGLPAEPLWLNQVHGTDVVDAGVAAHAGGPPTADAIVSADGGHVLGILTADCLPVILCSLVRDEFAALHCGWRSLSGGIVAAAINHMQSDGAELAAWLGPGISSTAFEVGDDVRDVFLAGMDGAQGCFEQNANGRWQADLYGLARRYLAAAGVERIGGTERCTVSDEARWFSYRRDGQCGRMATFAFRRGRTAN